MNMLYIEYMLYYICIFINIHLYILILCMGNKPLPDWIRTK